MYNSIINHSSNDLSSDSIRRVYPILNISIKLINVHGIIKNREKKKRLLHNKTNNRRTVIQSYIMCYFTIFTCMNNM